jgi:murein DD-endopeptidase MepM/ murein hydrolase activator NlpD
MPRALLWRAREKAARARSALKVRISSRRWVHAGAAVLAAGALGVGAAGSMVVHGNAERPLPNQALPAPAKPAVVVSVAPGVPQPKAFTRTQATPTSSVEQARAAAIANQTSRDAARTAQAAKTAQVARARAQALAAQALAAKKEAAKRHAAKLAAQKKAAAAKKKAAAAKKKRQAAAAARRKAQAADDHAVLPVAGGRTAAGFGATGAWARYHTGVDFSAGSGTRVRAPRAGVVTTSGSGKASGWAGTYVTIRHSDGTSSLYAHLSSTAVSDGERVSAGDLVGRVGQTGRAFGPHLHFEVYPEGETPGDVYSATNPRPWLRKLGLRY